jgi:hypothetical protein
LSDLFFKIGEFSLPVPNLFSRAVFGYSEKDLLLSSIIELLILSNPIFLEID